MNNLFTFYFAVEEKPKEEFGTNISKWPKEIPHEQKFTGFFSEQKNVEENIDKYLAF